MFPEWGLWHVGMEPGLNVTELASAAPYCGWFPSLGKDAPYSSSIYLAWWIKGKWLFLCLSTKVWPDHWVKIEIFLRSKPFLGWPGTSWPFRPPAGCPCSCFHGPFRSLDSLKQSEWPRVLQSLLFCPLSLVTTLSLQGTQDNPIFSSDGFSSFTLVPHVVWHRTKVLELVGVFVGRAQKDRINCFYSFPFKPSVDVLNHALLPSVVVWSHSEMASFSDWGHYFLFVLWFSEILL